MTPCPCKALWKTQEEERGPLVLSAWLQGRGQEKPNHGVEGSSGGGHGLEHWEEKPKMSGSSGQVEKAETKEEWARVQAGGRKPP